MLIIGVRGARPSDSSVEIDPVSWSVAQRFGKMTMTDNKSTEFLSEEAPPRPPKPSHLGKGPSYLNLGATPTGTLKSKNSGENGETSHSEKNKESINGSQVIFNFFCYVCFNIKFVKIFENKHAKRKKLYYSI